VGFLRSVVADARPRGSLQHSPSVSSPERKHESFSQAADSTLLSGETGSGGTAKPQSLSIEAGAGYSQINRFGDSSLMDSMPPASNQSAEYPVRPENLSSVGAIAGDNISQPVSERSLTTLLPGGEQEVVATPSGWSANPPMPSQTNQISAPLRSTDDGGGSATATSEFVAIKRLHISGGANDQIEQTQGASELSDLDYTDESSPIEGKASTGGLQLGTAEENRSDVNQADFIYPNEVGHQPSEKNPVSQELARQTRREPVMADSRSSGQLPVEQAQNSALDKTIRTAACSADAGKKMNDMDRKVNSVLKGTGALQVDHAEKAESPASVPPRPVHQGSTVSDAVKSATILKPAKPSLAKQVHQISEQSLDRAVNHAISRQSSKKAPGAFAGPKVQIGQIDVTIEVQQQRSESRSTRTSPLALMASRHYLRGL